MTKEMPESLSDLVVFILRVSQKNEARIKAGDVLAAAARAHSKASEEYWDAKRELDKQIHVMTTPTVREESE